MGGVWAVGEGALADAAFTPSPFPSPIEGEGEGKVGQWASASTVGAGWLFTSEREPLSRRMT